MIAARPAGVETEHGQVLDVLGQDEGTAVEHEDAFAAVGAAEPEMLGERGTERAPADDDEIERPQITRREARGGARIRVDGDQGLIEGVANVAPQDVPGERGVLGRERHRCFPPASGRVEIGR